MSRLRCEKSWGMQYLFCAYVFCALGLFCSGTSAPAVADTSGISAEAFGTLPNFELIKLSPTGNRLAGLQIIEGHEVLVTQSFEAKDENKVHFSTFKNYRVAGFDWVNDERLVISLMIPKKIDHVRFYITRMIAMNWDKSNNIQLQRKARSSQFHSDVISMLPDDPDHILVGVDYKERYYPDAYKLNVNDDSMELKMRNMVPVVDWDADQSGAIRMGYARKDNRDSLVFRNSPDDDWRTLYHYDAIKEDAPFLPVGFTEQPHIIYVARQDEGGHQAFYRYDTAENRFLEKVAGHDNFDISGLILSETGALEGYHYVDEYTKIVYLTPFFQTLQRQLQKNFPDHISRVVSQSRDRRKFIIKVTGPDLPGDYYLLNLDSKEFYKFGLSHPQVDQSKLSPMEIVRYRARDGLEIPGYLSLPQGVDRRSAPKIPMVILPHGGPFARDSYGYNYWVQFLTTRGYGVLQMNYRGSSGYGKAFEEKGYHEWGRKMLEDINDGTKWVIAQGIADPNRICIMGGSYGGYAALQAVVKDPTLYKCSVAMAAVTDVKRKLEGDRRYRYYRRWHYYIRNDELSANQISPAHHVDKLNLPILLIHGTEDERVPYAHSKVMSRAFKKARKPHKFVTLKDGDHYLSRQKNRIRFFQEVEKFLAKNL